MTPETLTTEAQELREAVETIGGWLDGGLRYMLVFTLPVAIGFPTIEKLFDEAVRKIRSRIGFMETFMIQKMKPLL